jgi:hypothetical protein
MEIDIVLPRPHPAQQLVLDCNARWRVLLCGRRFGKSLVARIEAIQHMLNKKKVGYVTPTFDLAKTFFNLIIQSLPPTIIKTQNKSELLIELITGGSIKFYSGEALERFRGHDYDFIIIDEMAFIPNMKVEWETSIRPTLSDRMGSALFISTPNGMEFFYSLFEKGNDPLETDYKSFHFPSNTNPHFPTEEFESARKSLPSAVFNQEYLAIPSANADNPFGTDNINMNIISELSQNETIVYGIDVARTYDYSVIIGLDIDGNMTYYDRFQQPWELTKNRIEKLPNNILKVIDATGVGSVLLESLSLSCENIQGFTFTNESKSRIIYELIKDVENGGVKYNETTANEMHTFMYKYSSTGTLTFNAMNGYHDDSVCALALANSHRHQAVNNLSWKLFFV